MPLEINYYDLSVHKLMLSDPIRCDSFRQALEEWVNPESVVLDIGAGTGLLSLFAAKAGAKKVYAVERTKTARLAKQIVADNELSGQICVIENDMEKVELPEQVDVIVSEWLGGYGIDENLLPVIVQARERWLKPGGVLIPGDVSSWIAPAYDDLLEQDLQRWNQHPYGLNLKAISEQTARQLHCCRNHIKEEQLLADPQLMWEIDPASITYEQSTSEFETKLEFICRRSGRFNVLAAWFETQLSPGCTLTNKPSEQYTHWGRWVFPFGACLEVEQGETISVQFKLQPQGKGQTTAFWQVDAQRRCYISEDKTSLTR